MGFRVKSFVQIVSDMVAHMRASQRRVSDFNVGSVNRVLLEASGAEVDELYQSYAQGLIESIPVALYRGFDFDLRPALAASGLVRFRATPDHVAQITIPIGFLVSAGSVQYQVAAQAVIPIGADTVDALVVCATPGTAGNAQPDTIVSIVSGNVQDLASVTNPAAFSNGRGIESNEDRKLRFIEFVKALARGTPHACKYAAKLAQVVNPATGVVLERVARVELEETPGHVDMWIHNGAGGTSDALLARAADLVHGGYPDPVTGDPSPGYDPTGMRVDVQKMAEIPVAVSLRIQAAASSRTPALRARVVAAVSQTIRGVRSGGRLLPIDLVNAALALRAPVQGAEVDAPLVSVACPINAVLVPGAVTVDWIV